MSCKYRYTCTVSGRDSDDTNLRAPLSASLRIDRGGVLNGKRRLIKLRLYRVEQSVDNGSIQTAICILSLIV